MIETSRDTLQTAFILGTNEIASAVAVALHKAGFACLLSHIRSRPSSVGAWPC